MSEDESLLSVSIRGRMWTLSQAWDGPRRWRATREETLVVAVKLGPNEMMVAMAWIDPRAEGGATSPRFGAEEWTLAKVIET